MSADQNLTVGIGLDTSGFTKGEKALLESYARLMSRDKSLKQEIEKKPKSWGTGDAILESERKVKNNLAGLVSDLANVRSGGDAARVTILRLSETFKLGFGVGVGMAIGEAVNDALKEAAAKISEQANEWRSLLSFNTSAGATEGALRQQLAAAIKSKESAEEELSTMNNPVAAGNFIPGYRQILEDKANSSEQERVRVANQLADLTERNLDIQTDALLGEKQISEQKKLQLDYEQKLHEIRADTTLTPSARSRMETAAGIEYRQKSTASALAENLRKMQSNLAGELLSASAEDNANPSTIAAARLKWAKAARDMIKKNGSKDQLDEADAKVRESEVALRNAEREADLQKRTSAEMTRAMEERIAGHTRLGRIIERNARTEAEAAAAERAGNPDEAKQIRARARLEALSDSFSEAYSPSSGKLKSTRSRFREMQGRLKAERNQADALGKFRETGGLLNVHRGLDGEILSGVDPLTGERRAPNSDELGMMAEQASKNAASRFKSAGKAEQLASSPGFWKGAAPGGTSKAETVGSDNQSMSQAEFDAIIAKKGQDGSATPSNSPNGDPLSQILSILRAWDG